MEWLIWVVVLLVTLGCSAIHYAKVLKPRFEAERRQFAAAAASLGFEIEEDFQIRGRMNGFDVTVSVAATGFDGHVFRSLCISASHSALRAGPTRSFRADTFIRPPAASGGARASRRTSIR